MWITFSKIKFHSSFGKMILQREVQLLKVTMKRFLMTQKHTLTLSTDIKRLPTYTTLVRFSYESDGPVKKKSLQTSLSFMEDINIIYFLPL